MRLLLAACLLVTSLGGCAMLAAGAIGAAVTPLVQPQIDRVLVGLGWQAIDPGGTAALKP